MAELNIGIRDAQQVRVVDVRGDIDLRGAPTLRKTLFDCLHSYPKVAVNLAAIRYIDSSGVAVLIETVKEAQRLNRRFVLFGMSPAVHDVFKLTHVLRIFTVAETEADALAQA